MHIKNLYIIAGPNGSGKTTFARKFLPDRTDCTQFINADLIAQGLSPFSPVVAAMKAGRLVLKEIEELSGKGLSFAFETTLSGKTYISLLNKLRNRGYRIHLFFLWIPSSILALERIKERVKSGGHDAPPRMSVAVFVGALIIFSKSMSHWQMPGCCLITPEKNTI